MEYLLLALVIGLGVYAFYLDNRLAKAVEKVNQYNGTIQALTEYIGRKNGKDGFGIYQAQDGTFFAGTIDEWHKYAEGVAKKLYPNQPTLSELHDEAEERKKSDRKRLLGMIDDPKKKRLVEEALDKAEKDSL